MSDVPETALPPLPEAYIPLLEHYTASQMKAYARAAIEAAVREQPNPQQGDSAVASEGGSCVSDFERAATGVFMCATDVIYALSNGLPFQGADERLRQALVRFAVERGRPALSTAGAQRRASEQDETTSAKEQR